MKHPAGDNSTVCEDRTRIISPIICSRSITTGKYARAKDCRSSDAIGRRSDDQSMARNGTSQSRFCWLHAACMNVGPPEFN